MRFALLFLGLALLISGCLGEEQPENATELEEHGISQAEEFRMLKFTIVHDTPGTRAAGKPWVQTAVLDLDNKRYAVADSQNYLVLAYADGTAYRAVKTTAANCSLSSRQRDFYKMDVDEFPLNMFLFFEAIKDQFPDMYENSTRSLQDTGEGEYMAYVVGLENSTYRKYGDSYFGSNVTFISDNQSYNFVYRNVRQITEGEFDLFLNEKMGYMENCKIASE